MANLASAQVQGDHVTVELTHGPSQHVLVLEVWALADNTARVRLNDKQSTVRAHARCAVAIYAVFPFSPPLFLLRLTFPFGADSGSGTRSRTCCRSRWPRSR